MARGLTRKGYGVKLVRGPMLRLAPSPDSVDDGRQLLALCARFADESQGSMFAADLFSGAGGLSLGLENAGFTPVLSVDNDVEAIATHRHHFPGLSVDWDLAQPDQVQRVGNLCREVGIDLIAGGPPCQPFSKAGRSKVRHQIHHGLSDPHVGRRDLWRSFLEIVRIAEPRAVLMENVPDMALDKDMFILRAMTEELESLGYSVRARVVDAWRYGVPQFRQRLILVALRGDLEFDWPAEAADRVTVWNAIGDLPEVSGGWRPAGGQEGSSAYEGPRTAYQKEMRRGIEADANHRVHDHITRPVRDDDARAFDMMDSSTKYSDLPEELRRYRADIFDDKYKRLDENDLSRTITAHIAKDGYWYIHPRQPRTITVREAARIQSFPDRYRFSGPPTAAFKQIGNAVPPKLAETLALGVRSALDAAQARAFRTRDTAKALSAWFDSMTLLRLPWLRAETRWQVIAADLLLDRADRSTVSMLWPVITKWAKPGFSAQDALVLRQIGRMTGRETKVETLLSLGSQLAPRPELLEGPGVDHTEIADLWESTASLATLVVPAAGDDESEEPILANRGVLRPASRFIGQPVDQRNQLTDGRMAVASLVGGGLNSRHAQLGLIELAATVCRPKDPLCSECPLSRWCVVGRSSVSGDDKVTLF